MDKQEIILLMIKHIDDKVNYLQGLISDKRNSNNETKSSMGDKYETSREMLQQEINLIQKQLLEAMQQQEIIQKLSPAKNNTAIFGALIDTSMGTFFISCGTGELNYKGNKIIGISPQSPLAISLFGKKESENFLINNQSHTINTIY